MNYEPQKRNLLNAKANISAISCIMCKKMTPARSFSQKYCAECSEIANSKRKIKWAKKNPEKIEITRKTHNYNTSPYRKSAGIERSKDIPHGGFAWTAQEDILPTDVDIGFRLTVPFTHQYSKNAIYSLNGRGHVYIRDEVRALKNNLIEQIKLSGVKWRVNKVYLDILVQKPDMRGDAINVIDTIADAVKKGIDLDDNWFCIRRLDWEIVKINPKIFIGISQRNYDEYPCSYCGKFLSFDCFTKNRNSRFGINSECRDCLRDARKLARLDNKTLRG